MVDTAAKDNNGRHSIPDFVGIPSRMANLNNVPQVCFLFSENGLGAIKKAANALHGRHVFW
jgi:hypothetical protein